MVNDILDLSKLESYAIELQEEPIAIASVLRRIASNFDSLAEHLDIGYRQSISETLEETWLLLDAAKLEKILNNLLSNALKHTHARGVVELSAVQSGENLLLEVSDTGQGISEKDLPHIFDRFFQSKQPDAPIQGGTGIGLALSKELTQLMNGKVTVNSKVGKGSTFSLCIPYQEVAAWNTYRSMLYQRQKKTSTC